MRRHLAAAVTLFALPTLAPIPPENAPQGKGRIPQPAVAEAHAIPQSAAPLPASTLEHTLFLEEKEGRIIPKPTREELPDLERHTALKRLRLQRGDNEIIFYDKENPVPPLEIYTHPKADPAWKKVEKDIDLRRKFMISRAPALERQAGAIHRLPAERIGYRVGARDRYLECLERAQPYFSAGKNILESYGLPWQVIFLGCQESDWRPQLTSKALCVGTHQINEWNARKYGLVIPKTTAAQRKKPGSTIRWLSGQPDERRHPLLAIHAMARLMRKDAYSTGSVHGAIAAYIAGTDYLDPVRAYAYKTKGRGEKPLDWLSHTIGEGWKEAKEAGARNPIYRTGFGPYSAGYLSDLLAAVLEIPAGYFEQAKQRAVQADIVTIQYAGRERLTGASIARAIGDEEYRRRNPHIPPGATIPEGMRVELPRGAAETLFSQYGQRLVRNAYLIVQDGEIASSDGQEPFLLHSPAYTPLDLRFSQLAERRASGGYSAEDAAELDRLIDAYSARCKQEQTPACAYQLGVLLLDRESYDRKPRKHLAAVASAHEESREAR